MCLQCRQQLKKTIRLNAKNRRQGQIVMQEIQGHTRGIMEGQDEGTKWS